MATPTQFRNEAPTPGRPRALALVEAQIPEAEIDRDRWLTVVAALTATKQPCRRENAMLRWAEERVALLHRSRATLVAEAAGHGAVIGRRKAKPTPPENPQVVGELRGHIEGLDPRAPAQSLCSARKPSRR